MIQRSINKVTSHHLHQGFLGTGHQAAAIIDGNDFARTDPFIILMDDRLALPGGSSVGGPHPHAGFETVTLVLQGDGKDWKTGSLELMTAGKGIIHTEEIDTKINMHILQLWLVLPPEKRWAQPFWQQILLEDVPTLKSAGREIRVYSGSSNGLSAPLQNHTPFTLVDFSLAENATATQILPAQYNGFIYVLEGEVSVGTTTLKAGQSGWLNEPGNEESEMTFIASEQGARFVLYAGLPQRAPIVSQGPFIGDTREDISRLYQEFRRGQMPHLNELPESSKVRHQQVEV